MPTSDLDRQMVMGQGIREYISLNPFNYLRRAPRLQVAGERVFQSGVKITDVSFYQKIINFIKMKSAGAVGTIIRAGQNTWVDPYFEINWEAAKDATLPRGSYYFFDSRATPKAQADLYWSLIKNDIGELVVTADYEESYGGSYGGWRNLYDFTERLLGNGVPLWKLWIYTGYYYWLDHSPQNDSSALAYFKQFKMWIPWYTSSPSYVKIPKPWLPGDVPLWQYGTPAVGAQYGVSTTEIDMNEWQGDLASYKSFFKLGGATPPPEGDTVHYGKVTTAGLNIRNSPPGGSYVDIGDLNDGDLVVASEIVNGWWHLVDAKHNGQPVLTSNGTPVANRTDCWASGGYITETEPPVQLPAELVFEPFELRYTENGVAKSQRYIPE